jgi:16S rRNA (cytosine1402-N4)-methyltransferase
MPGRETASRDSAPDPGPHVPVLLDEVVRHLAPSRGARIIDGTFGAGGYTRALLEAAPDVHVLAIERDPDALAAGRTLLDRLGGSLRLVPGRFGDLAEIAATHDFRPVNGVVLDIGVSSMQLDRPERGFSFMADGPLDMRMEREGPSAADIVNTSEEADLAGLIFAFGEERQSRRIARALVRAREAGPIASTRQLASIVERALGRRHDDDRHPATRTFQALRIAVNDELGELVRGLEAAEVVLAPGGRLVVVSFHSLEDRLVKTFLATRSGAGGVSRHLPETARPAPSFTLLGRRPVIADDAEVAANPRARSAKLRAAVRTAAPAWCDTPPAAPELPPLAALLRGG